LREEKTLDGVGPDIQQEDGRDGESPLYLCQIVSISKEEV
jgi:hypothetical protein